MDFDKIKENLCNLCRQNIMPFYCRVRRAIWHISVRLQKYDVTANYCSLCGIAVILLGMNFLAMESYFLAFLSLLLYRLIRVVALNILKLKKQPQTFVTDSSDYFSLTAYLLGFALANPWQNALGACFLLAVMTISNSTLVNYNSATCLFGKFRCRDMRKLFSLGLSRENEIFYALLIMSIFPYYFLQISVFFGLLAGIKALLVFATAFYDLEFKTENIGSRND